LPDTFKLYAELPGYLASSSPPIIPTNLSSTFRRHDFVLVFNDSIYLLEVTAGVQKEDVYSWFFTV